MDRRTFSRLALTGLGIAVLPPSVTRAEPEDLTAAKGTGAAPLSSWAPPSARTPGVPDKPYARLLDRARAMLDTHAGAFALRDRIAIADFSMASRALRFHIVDLVSGQANSYLVAHGRGSDPEHSGWLRSFSNEPGSLATSDGAYKTGEIYHGVHGAAMRLIGLDSRNNNAESRAIVIHGADYVGENQIATWGKLGRSEGCFAVAPHMLPQVLGMLGPGRLLYADKV
ncbi:murein L,D-transpeptidase catalytic domain family protein [Sphingomonas colocasiae]|uniref:Murein L,D-transpeptidase catalytic domain family protein n=1 Tax=Sphingomonas colocasiae TaxID=1848973 RepID=A0ABS7PK39_9SPHN|nr:murein L,D-transpeptidase catalytic domain family protein [Sphingomonas colocasiae]MBY8821647.1 murein L,D-transpeptidase catalytic domain family protein [Sphingomonas colocasiae]